ncbi:hypothetical protein [uncultured Gammaproteobacteria bacterium]|nr:hypothetical protein [uncultured Gammaproteobacteria bacterium]
MNIVECLFSYGTLQDTSVQLETFGRKLEGHADQLLGHKLEMVEICDVDVVALSGETHHPIAVVSKDKNDFVSGVIFEITPEELAQSDEYEVNEYKRVMGEFKSGQKAWVYVQA